MALFFNLLLYLFETLQKRMCGKSFSSLNYLCINRPKSRGWFYKNFITSHNHNCSCAFCITWNDHGNFSKFVSYILDYILNNLSTASRRLKNDVNFIPLKIANLVLQGNTIVIVYSYRSFLCHSCCKCKNSSTAT